MRLLAFCKRLITNKIMGGDIRDKMNSMRDFFKKHIVIAILTVFIAGFLINEGLYQMGEALHFSLGTSNKAFFITEIIRKVIPALLIAFCIGTLDSLKYPLKDFGKSLLSGAWILFLAVLGSVVNCVEAMDDGSKITSPSEIVFYILFMLMIGLAEELLMRGTITRLLAEKFGKEGKGMVISVMIGAVCFGLYHLSNYLGTYDLKATLHQVLATTLSGMLLCAIYVKWGNLLAVIILHAAFDFAALFEYGMIAGKSIADRHSRGAGDFKQILISNSTFIIAAVIVMVHKKKKKNIPVEESVESKCGA